MACRYGRLRRLVAEDDDAVQMIGHNDVRAQFDVREMGGDCLPALIGNVADGGEAHLFSDDRAEEMCAGMRDDGDEICTGGGIVEARYAHGTAMMGILVSNHADIIIRRVAIRRN